MPGECPLLVLNGRLEPALARWLVEVRAGRKPETGLGPHTVRDDLLAVDGGADRLVLAGLPAAIVAGDLDSVSDEALAWHEARGARRVLLPDPDANDLEKVLALARERGARRGCVAAFEGARLDMLLGLFALLGRADTPPLLLLGSSQIARALPPGEHAVPTAADEPFSLVAPIRAAAVELKGAVWTLDRSRPLEPGCRGVSNRATGDELLVSSDAPLLLFRAAPWSGDRP